MAKLLTDSDLASVVGGNAWDALDNGISMFRKDWKSYSCPVRTAWVGLGIPMLVCAWYGWRRSPRTGSR